eukprot:975370-Pyramimonas_sp.AAC.1
MQRLVGYSDAGLTRQVRLCASFVADYFRKVDRNEDGKVIRSKRTGAVKSQEALIERDLERATIEERTFCRGVACTCPEHADRGLGCPMRRPSRSPNFRKTPWVWSHGGRGYCVDPNAAPWEDQLAENDLSLIHISEPTRPEPI